MLRTIPSVLGGPRRWFGDRVRHRKERSAVRLVVGEVDRRSHDGAQADAPARRVFHRGRRQHPETVDAEQRAAEHPGAGRDVRQDQTQDPVRRDRSRGRVRVLRHQHGGHNENQTELLARHGGGDAVRLAGAGRVLRQARGGQEARRPRGRRRAVQQGRHGAVPDGRRRDHGGGLRGRGRGAGAAKGPGGRRQDGRPQGAHPAGDAHAPAAGGAQVGQRGLVRDQHTGRGRPAAGRRHTGGHGRLRAVHRPGGGLRRHVPVHVPHVRGVRPGVPARLQRGVRDGQQARRARVVGGHAAGAAPRHRAQLHVLRRAVLVRRVADRHVVGRRQHTGVRAGDRAPAVRRQQLSQQGRVGHRHVQGRPEAAERRRRGPGARVARGRRERRAAGRAQGAQGPGELDRRAPAGPRGHHGQRGRHVRRVGHRAVHAAVHHVLVDDIHQRPVPSERRAAAHVRHEPVHRVLGGARRVVDPRDRRVFGVGAQFTGRHAQRCVYLYIFMYIMYETCARRHYVPDRLAYKCCYVRSVFFFQSFFFTIAILRV